MHFIMKALCRRRTTTSYSHDALAAALLTGLRMPGAFVTALLTGLRMHGVLVTALLTGLRMHDALAAALLTGLRNVPHYITC